MNIVNYIVDRTKKYHKLIIIILLVSIFTYAAVHAYKYEGFDTNSETVKFKDVANSQEFTPTVQLYMFYVDWCPHCKTAKPEWDRIKRKYENQPVGGYLVECIDVDCTDDYGEVTVSKSLHGMETPPKVADLIKQYGINGYPTLKLVKDGTPYDFEAKITEPNISKFVEEILNE